MARQPNIVFIMADHANSAALAPGSQCRTPNLDALAAEGARFGRCYTVNAICSPSRASLMTGLYPSTHGVWDCTHTQRPEWVDLPPERAPHFAGRLADAGYSNGYFGKWHIDQSGRLEDFGWSEYDISCNRAELSAVPGSELIVTTPGYRDYVMAGSSASPAPTHPAYDKGIDFIGRHCEGDEPFCVFISTSEPHDAYVAPQEFLDLYDLDAIELPASLHDDCADKPEVVRRMASVFDSVTDDDWRKARMSYWAVMTFLDREVGRVVDALKAAGVYDETIIVFTSDHGDMLGGHGLATKGVGTPYEEVYNIPLVVRLPGGQGQGENGDAVVSMVDIAPTLLHLAGAAPIESAQGTSFARVLSGEEAGGRDAYAEFYAQRFVYTQRITWHENWKYVFTPGGVDELYDLDADPGERKNLAGDAASEEVLHDMCRRMWRKMRDIGDDSLFGTQYAILRTAPIGPNSIAE